MRSFVEFLNEQQKEESFALCAEEQWKEYEIIKENCELGLLSLVYFTHSVKLAIEANSPLSEWGHNLNPWKYEVDAMLTAYYRAKYISAAEYCIYRNTFNHWMRCNYRAKKPFKIKD